MSIELPTSNDSIIWDIWLSALRMPSLTVADELGIFDALDKQQSTYQALAKSMNLSERGLRVLLPMLTALGLLDKRQDEYLLSDTSRIYLKKESPFYWGGVISSQHNEFYTRILQAVTDKQETDDKGETIADGWETGQMDMETARRVTQFMHSHSQAAALGLAKNGDFSEVARLLDVGGGSGVFPIELVKEFPQLSCTIMELPPVCKVAEEYAAAAGVANKVDTIVVDMFREAWPTAYDAMLFSNVFHDWSFETCAELAQSAFDALPSGGRIFHHEMLLNDGNVGPLTTNAFSVLMLLSNPGSQFTYKELTDILATAGFVNFEVKPTYGYYSLVTGYKP